MFLNKINNKAVYVANYLKSHLIFNKHSHVNNVICKVEIGNCYRNEDCLHF
jgi:hypothetical protein